MKRPIAGMLLFALLLVPSLSLASGPPLNVSHIDGLSFTNIYSDDKGRSIAIIPEDQATEIRQACEAHKPLWLYGSPEPGKCLGVLPSSFPEDGIDEIQVTFAPMNYRDMAVLSTRDINKEKRPLRNPERSELNALVDEFHHSFSEDLIGKIVAVDLANGDKFFFVPVEKLGDDTEDPSDPPCPRLKTMVVLLKSGSYSITGFLDNMPVQLIDNQDGGTPFALTYRFCNTNATLWKIYPKVENKAYYSNGIGG